MNPIQIAPPAACTMLEPIAAHMSNLQALQIVGTHLTHEVPNLVQDLSISTSLIKCLKQRSAFWCGVNIGISNLINIATEAVWPSVAGETCNHGVLLDAKIHRLKNDLQSLKEQISEEAYQNKIEQLKVELASSIDPAQPLKPEYIFIHTKIGLELKRAIPVLANNHGLAGLSQNISSTIESAGSNLYNIILAKDVVNLAASGLEKINLPQLRQLGNSITQTGLAPATAIGSYASRAAASLSNGFDVVSTSIATPIAGLGARIQTSVAGTVPAQLTQLANRINEEYVLPASLTAGPFVEIGKYHLSEILPTKTSFAGMLAHATFKTMASIEKTANTEKVLDAAAYSAVLKELSPDVLKELSPEPRTLKMMRGLLKDEENPILRKRVLKEFLCFAKDHPFKQQPFPICFKYEAWFGSPQDEG